LNLQHAFTAQPIVGSGLRRQSRLELDRHSGYSTSRRWGRVGLRRPSPPVSRLATPTRQLCANSTGGRADQCALFCTVPLSSQHLPDGKRLPVELRRYCKSTLNARNYHGTEHGVAGYTYSHALDDVGANWDFGYGSGACPQNAHNPGAEYANSDFEYPQRLTSCFTHLRTPRPKATVKRWKVGKINSIITLETPQYWARWTRGTDAAGVGPLPVSPPATARFAGFYGKTSETSKLRRALEFPTSRTPRTRPCAGIGRG